MVPIDNIGKAMEILRRRMAENTDGSARASRSGASGERASSAHRPGVGETARRRIRALDPRDDQFHRRAVHAFVESALLAEFGESLVSDASFRDLIHDVAETMLGDGALDGELKTLIQELRAD